MEELKKHEHVHSQPREPKDEASDSFGEIISKLFVNAVWIDERSAFVQCPGIELHTSENGRRDCRLYLDGAPTLHCLHSSCRDAVESKNREVRQLFRSLKGGAWKPSKAQLNARVKEQRKTERLRRQVRQAKQRVFELFAWPLAEMSKSSPTAIPTEPEEHGKALLQIFDDEDTIWIGGKFDSGACTHGSHFLKKGEWLEKQTISHQFICPSTFKPGSCARSNDNICVRRFLVVESDELSKGEVSAVFRWLQEKLGLTLRAVVDTAGKSLHGWFDFPRPELFSELKIALPELGCDPKLFTPSQPVRFPGAIREGKYQTLIFLNAEVKP